MFIVRMVGNESERSYNDARINICTVWFCYAVFFLVLSLNFYEAAKAEQENIICNFSAPSVLTFSHSHVHQLLIFYVNNQQVCIKRWPSIGMSFAVRFGSLPVD